LTFPADADAIPVLLQARASSIRLPGKVLRPLHGKPLLAHAVDRLRRCRSAQPVLIATSDDPTDDAVAALAAELGVACWRGPMDDVVTRLLDASHSLNAKAFVRICGDSPFIDPELVDRAVVLFRSGSFDLATNILSRSFPKGQSVEVIRRDALAAARPAMNAAEREHVTTYFYAHASRYRAVNFSASTDNSLIQLSIDTEADFAMAAAMMARMSRPPEEYGVEELLRLRDDVLMGPP